MGGRRGGAAPGKLADRRRQIALTRGRPAGCDRDRGDAAAPALPLQASNETGAQQGLWPARCSGVSRTMTIWHGDDLQDACSIEWMMQPVVSRSSRIGNRTLSCRVPQSLSGRFSCNFTRPRSSGPDGRSLGACRYLKVSASRATHQMDRSSAVKLHENLPDRLLRSEIASHEIESTASSSVFRNYASCTAITFAAGMRSKGGASAKCRPPLKNTPLSKADTPLHRVF